MYFAIHCYDKNGQAERRNDLNSAHKAHLEGGAIRIVLAGPLLGSADESHRIGSLFVIEASTEDEARAFLEADPFWGEGIWDQSTVRIDPLRIGYGLK